MTNKPYVFTTKQKYTLYLIAGLLWLTGIAIAHYFDGLELSFRFFISLTIALLLCVSSTQKVKLWVNISVIGIGIFYIVMWYLDYLDPSGTPDVKNWWIPGVVFILMGIYWLAQRALVLVRPFR